MLEERPDYSTCQGVALVLKTNTPLHSNHDVMNRTRTQVFIQIDRSSIFKCEKNIEKNN